MPSIEVGTFTTVEGALDYFKRNGGQPVRIDSYYPLNWGTRVAHHEEELKQMVEEGIKASPISTVRLTPSE